MQLLDPGGAVVWEGPVSGFWDMNRSKYKTSKEKFGEPGSFAGGGTVTHFHFGLRDPGDAMAEEAWDYFVQSVGLRFPRVQARIDGKLVPLPLKVAVVGK